MLNVESKSLKIEGNKQWKETLIFGFFLLLAFSFWLLLNLQQDVQRKITRRLNYEDLPLGWVLTEDAPQTINISLKDKGLTLLAYLWQVKSAPVNISVSDLAKPTDTTLFMSHEFLEKAVAKQLQLLGTSTIVSIEPNEIRLHIDRMSSSILPVAPNIKVQTKAGFGLSDSIRILEAGIKVYGSKKVLDTMRFISTKHLALKDLSDKKEVTLELDLPAGIQAERTSVKALISVEEYTEKTLNIGVVCPNIPPNYMLRMFPASVEVICSLPLSQFKALNAEDLEIIMPFSDFKAKQTTGKITVKLTKSPAYVINPVIVPEELEFIIETLKND
ncbi:MAG: hypothetical protein LBS80_00305 [Tannerella sp.]|jgi:YbbR domain-containing protein|nr:hypothetical protein [Tannerella sp.]